MLFVALADGGPLMVPIVSLSLVAAAVCLVAGLARLARLRFPLALTLVLPVAVLCVGAAGTLMGLSQAYDAMAHASAEMKQTLLAAGISAAMYTVLIAGIGAAVALCVAMLSTAIGTVGRPGEGVRWTVGHAVAPACLALLAAVGCALTGHLGLAAVAVVGALSGGLVALRAGAEDADAARCAEARGHVAALGALAAVAAAVGGLSLARTQLFRAVAHAPAESKQQLLFDGLDMLTGWPGLLTALALLAGGAASAVPMAKHFGRRSVVGGVAAAAVLLGGVIPIWVGQARVQHLFHDIGSDASYVDGLASRGIALPPLDAHLTPPLALVAQVSDHQVSVDGRHVADLFAGAFHHDDVRGGVPAALHEHFAEKAEVARMLGEHIELAFRGRLRLEADAGLRWETVRGVLYAAWAADFRETDVVGVSDGSLVAVRVALVGGSPPDLPILQGERPVRPEADRADERFVELMLEPAEPEPEPEPEPAPPVVPAWSLHVGGGLSLEGAPTTLQGLPAAVAQLGAGRPRLLVSADPDVTHGELAAVLCAIACQDGPFEVALSLE